VPKSVAERAALFLAWALCLVIFYAATSGVTSTNDGGHFALANSLIERGSAVLADNVRYSGHDTSVYEGKAFAGRDPGTGILAFVFYEALGWLAKWQRPLVLDPYSAKRADSPDRERMGVLMLLPALLGAGLLLVGYGLIREFEVSWPLALWVGLSGMFGTILFRYATLLYSHVLTALLVTSAFWLFVRARPRREGCLAPAPLFTASLLLAYAVVVEPIVVVLYPAVLLYLSWGRVRRFLLGREVLFFGLGGFGPLLVLTSFNWIYFDHPLYGAYFHHAVFTWAARVEGIFSLSATTEWAWRLLFAPPPFTSLFLGSPFLVFALFAPFAGPRERTREILFCASAFASLWLVAASHKEPWGGYDQDYRYLVCVVPLLLPLAGLSLEALRVRGRRSLSVMAIVLYTALFMVALGLQVDHLRHANQIEFASTLVNGWAALSNTAPILILGLALSGAAAFRAKELAVGAAQE